MDSQQSMPQVSLPPVGGGDDSNQLNADLYPTKAPSTAESAVVYANQPLKPSDDAQLAVTPPSIADDVDLIEKEWVQKTSETIQKTKDDPYERARQLALLKSEYLQKRYQKTIKLT